jgi:hypothetical protein
MGSNGFLKFSAASKKIGLYNIKDATLFLPMAFSAGISVAFLKFGKRLIGCHINAKTISYGQWQKHAIKKFQRELQMDDIDVVVNDKSKGMTMNDL